MLGFEVVSIGDGEAVARFPVADRVRQRFGLVHGGAYAALAEMLATEATVAHVHKDGFAAMGTANDTSFLKAARGDVDHRARPRAPPRPHDLGVGDRPPDGEDRVVALSPGDDRGEAAPMRFENAYIPLNAAWSSPFVRWQGPAAELSSSLDVAAQVTARALDERGIDGVDELVLGLTVPQKQSFYGAPTLAAKLGLDAVSGPLIMQACATSVACIHAAAAGGDGTRLVVLTDRTSQRPARRLSRAAARPAARPRARTGSWTPSAATRTPARACSPPPSASPPRAASPRPRSTP